MVVNIVRELHVIDAVRNYCNIDIEYTFFEIKQKQRKNAQGKQG